MLRISWRARARTVPGALVLLALAPASADARPGVVVTSVKAPAGVAAGQRAAFTVRIRNATANHRRVGVRIRLSVSRNARGRIVARRAVVRLGPGRRLRVRLAGAIPRDLPAGRYVVTACARSAGARARARASCRRSGRPVVVRGSSSGTLGPAPPEPIPAIAPPLAAGPQPAPSPAATATASPTGTPAGTAFQTMEGFGASERLFDDPHTFENSGPDGRAATVLTQAQRDAVLDALYRELRLTRVRPVLPDTAPGAGIEPVNDDGDPYVTASGAFNFAWKRLDDHVPHVGAAQQRGVTTAFLSPLNRESWMGTTTAADVAEYSEWLLAMVRRFKAQGGRLTHLSVVNEPSLPGGNAMSAAFVRDVIKELAPRLAAEGLLVPFVVPDDVRASDAAEVAGVVLADPVARQYVGAVATHLYDEPTSNVAALEAVAKQYDLPLWMTEFSIEEMKTTGRGNTPLDWAVLMHELIADYDVSAIDYMWGFFGQWITPGTTLISLNHSDATYTGFTRNKSYYYFGQYSRFVEPGDRRVAVTSTNPSVRATAFWGGDRRVVVAINPTTAAVATTLASQDLAGVGSMSATRTSASENWAALPAVPVSGTSVSLTLPAGSATTLVGTAVPPGG